MIGLGLVLAAAPASYCSGQRVLDLLFPGGTPVKSASGQLRDPDGQDARTSSGTCYFQTGVEMKPCRRVVPVRETLAGGETIFCELDIVAGTIDLRRVRSELPAPGTIVSLIADLAAGRLDRASIGAVCPSR